MRSLFGKSIFDDDHCIGHEKNSRKGNETITDVFDDEKQSFSSRTRESSSSSLTREGHDFRETRGNYRKTKIKEKNRNNQFNRTNQYSKTIDIEFVSQVISKYTDCSIKKFDIDL